MDTLGALALGTESPSASVLERKPYKRSASLISRPMWRNILCQSVFQLTLLFVLLFKGAELFGVRKLSEKNCFTYYVENGTQKWDSATLFKSSTGDLSCSSFLDYCPKKDDTCYNSIHQSAIGYNFQFQKLPDFSTECLTCYKADHTHGSIIFNAFIFCQVCTEKSFFLLLFLFFLLIMMVLFLCTFIIQIFNLLEIQYYTMPYSLTSDPSFSIFVKTFVSNEDYHLLHHLLYSLSISNHSFVSRTFFLPVLQ